MSDLIMKVTSLPEDILQTAEETVILDGSEVNSQGFNDEYEELQKNLVFTPSDAVLWFSCEICKRKSATQERLYKHIEKKHMSEVVKVENPYQEERLNMSEPTIIIGDTSSKFKCTVCSFSCNTNADLMRHSKKHVGIKPFKCEICGKSFSQKGNLRPHLLRHSGIKPYKCEICGACYNHKSSFNKHITEHSEPKSYPCRYCPEFVFSCVSERNAHEKENHYGDDVHCVICGFILSSPTGLRMHVAQMHPDFYKKTVPSFQKKYECSYCSKMFSSKTYLKIHHKIHTGEKPYSCSVSGCNYSAISKDSLKKHCERLHNQMKLLSCNLCDQKFTYYSHKKAHLLKHYNLKPFKCDLCSRAFFSKRNLNDHKRLHEGDAKYWCHQCNVGYVLPDSLRKHMDQHLNSPIKCHICRENFWITGRFNRHMMKHRREFDGREKEKPHKCNKCNKSFKLLRFLQRHQQQSCVGDQKIECSECKKILPAHAYKKHLKRMHNISEHSCYICTESFNRIHLLQNHMELHHSDQLDENSQKDFDGFDSLDDGQITVETVEDKTLESVLFVDLSVLSTSIKTEPSDVSYECSCGVLCKTYGDLVLHREAYHEDEDLPAEDHLQANILFTEQ